MHYDKGSPNNIKQEEILNVTQIQTSTRVHSVYSLQIKPNCKMVGSTRPFFLLPIALMGGKAFEPRPNMCVWVTGQVGSVIAVQAATHPERLKRHQLTKCSVCTTH